MADNGNLLKNNNAGKNGNGRGKNSKLHKGHKKNDAPRQHHPWDEVSLPGSTNTTKDQPTILEVFNQVQNYSTNEQVKLEVENTATPEKEKKKETETETETKLTQTNNIINISNIDDKEKAIRHEPKEVLVESINIESESILETPGSVILVSNSSVEDKKKTHLNINETPIECADLFPNIDTVTVVPATPTATTPINPLAQQTFLDEKPHYLDIESHLIETTYDQSVEDSSVGIKELTPAKRELTQGSSKVETDEDNLRPIIEVEPVGVKTKQPIDTLHLRPTPLTQLTAEAKVANLNNLEHTILKDAAEKLVNDIEVEALQVLNNKQVELETPKLLRDLGKTTLYEKTEKEVIVESLDETDHETLTQKVDEKLSEITSILKAIPNNIQIGITETPDTVNADVESVEPTKILPKQSLKVIDGPAPQTPYDEQERKLFIESLPQLGDQPQNTDTETDAHKLSSACKREYYQSLKKYLIQSNTDKPPIPLQTYRWEDLRRAKERGGYPWTHLYKRPLGPDEEPEIVLLLRKSQELRFSSESPKSLKKVRIDEQVLVKETERYIQELSSDEKETDVEPDIEQDNNQTPAEDDEVENQSLHSESISCVSDSVLATGKPRKTNRLAHIRALLRRRRSGRHNEDAQSLPGTSTSISANTSRVHSQETLNSLPTTLANEQQQLPNTPEHKSGVRCYPIMKKLRNMADRQKKRLNIKRITLKKDEKIALGEDTKIMHLKNSPKCNRGEIPHFIEKQDSDDILEIVQLDESPSRKRHDDENIEAMVLDDNESAPGSSHMQPDAIIEIAQVTTLENGSHDNMTPRKTPRLRREHVYEEIEQSVDNDGNDAVDILPTDSVAALKESLAKQDNSITHELVVANKDIPLDRMGSSEEEPLASTSHLLAPISSIDSTSSEEAERIKSQLSPVAEESDDGQLNEHELAAVLRIVQEHEKQDEQLQLKPSIRKEPSPAPSDKKVTFSHVEDEAEPHREDIELSDEVKEAVAIAKRDKTNSDHEYEAIGIPSAEEKPSLAKVESTSAANQQNESQQQTTTEGETEGMHQAERVQREFEERYFSSETTTPRTESRTDYEIHTSQVDSSALEELPLKPENRKKTFMASAQDRTRRMQAGFKAQAGRIKSKLRPPMKKATTPTGSPKAKERKRFKAPDFSKIKMPEIKRPDMYKLKDFKRPEFTKFNKPDMSKFKMPEKLSKLRRSKSFKENEQPSFDSEMDSGMSPDSTATPESHQHKKMFDFHFGTYPRAFRKKKKPLEETFQSSLGTEEPSIIPSTETQPSLESSSSPKGDRGPGPVRSRWADKFSDVSYNDSEGSRYRRYGSEQESFDRESSLERRMKDDLEDTGSEVAPDLGVLSGANDTRQFAEFDEENRAIHEISSQRAGEFKRRPMIHQDSDLRSEDSKDVGWTDKEVQKNKLLRKAELEAEASYMYPLEEYNRQETHSTASSGKKVVMEQIDDDEFFIRKRGISEDNIQFRQYISHAIREGYDMPINALQHVGHTSEPMEYDDYDVPPPKPRRLHKSYRPEDTSQEFHSRSEFGDDLSISQNGSDFYPPKRPLRKGRSKYSMDSQDIPMSDEQLLSREQYFDDDEDYLRPPSEKLDNNLNDLNLCKVASVDSQSRPQAPRRRKRRESSMEKESYVNGLTGRSVSSSYLQPSEEVIVFRTEHQYPVPLATPEHYTDGSRSASRFGEDDQINRIEDDGCSEVHEKYVIDMLENDGYAVVRKEHVPKPTPPARRKKFTRSPGERFATLPNMRTKRSSTSPPERPPPPRDYKPSVTQEPQAPLRKSAPPQNYGQENEEIEDDYEEPGKSMWRAESPRDLQSGDVINKMKYRPLPAPPRPPREKRLRGSSRGSSLQPTEDEENFDDRDGGGERIASSSTAYSYEHHDSMLQEVEAATQTDPLPDDFVCEEFEITPDMKVIEPRVASKTLDELLRQEQQRLAEENEEDQQLTRGLQRFRDANQRTLSERSRASSQADHSRSLSRPQTPSSAVIIERRVSTPVSSGQQEQQPETMLAASLIVRPIDDLELEEQALRREGLLTDSSQQSKSDAETEQQEDAEETASKIALSDYSQEAASSVDLNAALENLRSGTDDSEAEILKSEQEDRDLDDLDVQALLDRIRQEEEEERKQQEYYENELQHLLEAEQALEEKQRLKEIEKKDIAEIRKLELEAEEARKLQEWVKQEKERQEREEEEELKKREEEVEAQIFVNKLKQKIERDIQEKEARKLEDKIEHEAQAKEKLEEDVPQPPPRRKSLANIEVSELGEIVDVVPTTNITTTATTATTIAEENVVMTALPTHISDLEVERLRVHALQAGQIMVGQLHGGQITSDELECKSGNLIVKSLELPPGFIEDIVERVRSSERGQLLSSETQTSEHTSHEQLLDETQAQAQILDTSDSHLEVLTNVRSLVPPPKPPRQRDLTTLIHKNLNEETQTDVGASSTAPMVPVFPTIEYLQSLAPLAFYNLEKKQQQQSEESHAHHHHRHHRHHYHRCESSGSDSEIASTLENSDGMEVSPPLRRRHHTRSPTTTTTTTTSAAEGDNQSLGQASRQFISACSLSLVRAINQLTSSFDEEKTAAVAADAASGIIAGNRLRQTPQQLFLLLVVVAVFILVFMLSGRNVHTHHWDYFNPPGNEGRPS